jgi:hypothetical protein
MRPECASWEMWIGREIEGTSDLGEETLFIRKLDISRNEFKENLELPKVLNRNGRIQRVWFCKEIMNWPLIREIIKHFKTSCLEATLGRVPAIPLDLLAQCTIYVKVDVRLKKGDHICIGPSYEDESFCIGTGNKVTPEQYAQDIRIK